MICSGMMHGKSMVRKSVSIIPQTGRLDKDFHTRAQSVLLWQLDVIELPLEDRLEKKRVPVENLAAL